MHGISHHEDEDIDLTILKFLRLGHQQLKIARQDQIYSSNLKQQKE
jgi:hypothetical protein